MTRVLIIEDDTSIRANLCRLLGLQGYEVVEAGDGQSGIGLARRAQPDLILCDIVMPGLDGFAVLQALRADPATARIPFVFLTASAEPRDSRLGIEQGADAYITKPFQAERLKAIISELLARSR